MLTLGSKTNTMRNYFKNRKEQKEKNEQENKCIICRENKVCYLHRDLDLCNMCYDLKYGIS